MLTYNYKQLDLVRELNISKVTVSQWNIYVKQMMIEWVGSTTEILGGPGEVVEVDESKFGKRKYHKGRFIEGQWVFGGIQRGSNKIFLVPVESRDSDTFIKIIKYWVKPGSTIISDCWKRYKNLTKEGYKHLTVNHSLTFKNEITGAHTNRIESMWRHIKSFLPTYHRVDIRCEMPKEKTKKEEYKELLEELTKMETKLKDYERKSTQSYQMSLLHKYNEVKDAAQIFLGAIANIEGVTIKELHTRFDLPIKD